MNTATTNNTANVAAARTSPRGLRFASRPLTWYDLSCLGLLVTSLTAIAAGLLG